MARNSTKPKDDTNPAVEAENVNATPAPVGADENVSATTAPAGEDENVNATPAPAGEDEDFAGTHVVNTARGLNLRQRPSFGAKVLEVLPFGTAVQDIDPAGAPAGWLAVTAESGAVGFVAARYVSPIEE